MYKLFFGLVATWDGDGLPLGRKSAIFYHANEFSGLYIHCWEEFCNGIRHACRPWGSILPRFWVEVARRSMREVGQNTIDLLEDATAYILWITAPRFQPNW